METIPKIVNTTLENIVHVHPMRNKDRIKGFFNLEFMKKSITIIKLYKKYGKINVTTP